MSCRLSHGLLSRAAAAGFCVLLSLSLTAPCAQADTASASDAASSAQGDAAAAPDAAPSDPADAASPSDATPAAQVDATSELAAGIPAPALDSPIMQGLCDFFTNLEGRVDAHGQAVIAEKDLEHARRSDAVSEKLRMDAMNSKGDTYQKTMAAAEQLVDGTATVDDLGEAGESTEAPASDEDSAAAVDEPSAPSEKSPAKKSQPKKRKNTLRFGGEYVAFEQGSPADETAPAAIAAAWVSDGDVTDDENTYFIGHNPGVFSGVMDLELGDEITVWDGAGRKRNYYVFDVLTLPNQSNYFRYEGRIAPSGETITLQTCCADNLHVRCVMAR